MNYRHAYHAGNFADVMKHALLTRILLHLNIKEAPYRVIDSHAGIGMYDLAGTEANKTGEWRDGIGRLMDATLPSESARLFAPYLDFVRPGLELARPTYPGSPIIAQQLSRPQDRLAFMELHEADYSALRANIGKDERAKVLKLDGWMALKAQVPPPERRGVVLVDPPFEKPDEFDTLLESTLTMHRKWSTGTFMLWYPVKDTRRVSAFRHSLAESGIRKIMAAEVLVSRPTSDGGLSGSGVIIINPPWMLYKEAEVMMEALVRILRQGAGADARVEWLAGE